MNDFGSFLKRRREGAGIGQKKLSELLDSKGFPVHNSIISRWEAGDRLPTRDQRHALLLIGDLLRMSPDAKNDLLVKAGLAPLQREELDVETILKGIRTTYGKVLFLWKDLHKDEFEIAEILGIPFYDARHHISTAKTLQGREAPESALLIWIRDAGTLAIDPDMGKGGRLIRFTLGSCSDNVITVERIRLEVTKCEENKRRPPIEAKVTPWKLEVDLRPHEGAGCSYEVTTEEFRFAGPAADDFELVCRSPGGYKYTARLNVDYSDLATRKMFTAHSDAFELYFDTREALDRAYRKAP